jgi:hypothetical protein
MADVWVQGIAEDSLGGTECYATYKLFDYLNNPQAQGCIRVPDFWGPQGKPLMDIPRTPLAAEVYAVIRGILAAQAARYGKAVVHTPSNLVITLVNLPVKINNKTLRAMRDYIIELSTQIDVELVETSVWCVETILSDY